MKDLTITSVIKVYEYDELNDTDRALLDDAIEATRRSYAPYSHFSVGAAALLANGVVVTGECGLSVRTLCRTHHAILCQLAVSRPSCGDTCHRCTYREKLYRHSYPALRCLSPGDSGNRETI